MCFFSPKISTPKPVPPAQFQPMLQPQQVMPGSSPGKMRRRGLYASIFTSPQGISGAPAVTGTTGGLTGG